MDRLAKRSNFFPPGENESRNQKKEVMKNEEDPVHPDGYRNVCFPYRMW
jgi:hypothetical protein